MTDITDDLQTKLAALLAQVQQNPPAPQPSAWTKSQMSVITIAGVAVPISLETPRGKLRCYLSLPAECVTSPDALFEALAALDAQGYPLDIWEGRQSGGWGGGSDRGNGSGWRTNSRRWSR